MIERWLGKLLAQGEAPDPRFTLANERTFLAWIRTALAVVAAGIGVQTFATGLPEPWRKVAAVCLLALGALMAAASFRRWLANERALRQAAPLPHPGLVPVLAGALAVLIVALLVVVLARP